MNIKSEILYLLLLPVYQLEFNDKKVNAMEQRQTGSWLIGCPCLCPASVYEFLFFFIFFFWDE